MNLFNVYQAPYRPLPKWQGELTAALILPPMILSLVVWQISIRLRAAIRRGVAS